MGETNGRFDSCNSCNQLGLSPLHELDDSTLLCVSRIEFILSRPSVLFAHVTGGVWTHSAPRDVGRPAERGATAPPSRGRVKRPEPTGRYRRTTAIRWWPCSISQCSAKTAAQYSHSARDTRETEVGAECVNIAFALFPEDGEIFTELISASLPNRSKKRANIVWPVTALVPDASASHHSGHEDFQTQKTRGQAISGEVWDRGTPCF